VHEFPSLSRVLPLSVGFVLAVLLARHLYRHTPSTVAQVCTIAGVVMSVLILLAPDPRLGYVLYPVNFFVWAYLLAPSPEDKGLLLPDDRSDQLARTAVAAA
jgi:hypothetical protein